MKKTIFLLLVAMVSLLVSCSNETETPQNSLRVGNNLSAVSTVGSYNFSITNGTYTPLANKTVFQSGTQLNTDATSSAITLPFPFRMYGEAVTTAYLSNNGYIGFGSAPYRNNIYNAISSSETFASHLISFSNQITAWNGEGSQPEIAFGQNANNDMVFQFQDVSIQTAPAVRMTFQIVLKSDASTVQIVFGPNCTGQDQISNISVRGFEVGLRGLQVAPSWNPTSIFKSTVAGGYHNRLLVTGNWNIASNIKVGTQPSSTMSVRTGVNVPPTVIANMVVTSTSGKIYQWTAN